MVTDLNDTNEPIMFSKSILGNLCFKTFFGDLDVELSPITNSYTKFELLHCTHIAKPHCTLVDISSTNSSVEPTNPNLWYLYSESSRSKDGAVVGCLLIDPQGN